MRNTDGVVTGLPALLLRAEGGVLLLASLFFYWRSGSAWLVYVVLLLAPDVGMVGYLGGTRVGAIAYNLFHVYVAPAALLVAGTLAGSALLCGLALIWFGHIGMDRVLGYGLKYPSSFQHTHLGTIGRRRVT
jgi:hypothetical protein